ncbi:MAG: GyrI-like domain-containing protein [Gammaproteobacteria bacterium]|nr:GyrI-like domain-containing protein [Gammaproteobacteria bacterium]
MTAPTVKHVDGIKIHGFSTRTQNSDELNEETAKIPDIWQKFYASPLVNNPEIYGVYSDYASDANGLYTVLAGVPFDSKKTYLDHMTIQPGNYLVFENEGPMPETVIKTWQEIWAYFNDTSPYQRNFLSDFEFYTSTDKVAIYIGIK